MSMLLVLDRQGRATFEQVRVAQVQRDALGKVRTNCESLTFKAVAWTLTRRSTQGRIYEDGKKACFDEVAQATVGDAALGRRALAALAGSPGRSWRRSWRRSRPSTRTRPRW